MNGYQLRKQRKREAITRAARELFTLYGIRKVSVTEIAEKAGVNPVTIYNHFHDKGALAREVVKDLVLGEWDKYSGILKGEEPFLEKLRKVVSSKMEWARLGDGAFLAGALAEDEGVRELVESVFKNEVNPAIARFIRDGQRSGAVRRDLSIASINLYLDMFTSLARTHPELLAGRDSAAKATKEIWDLFLHGLMGRAGER